MFLISNIKNIRKNGDTQNSLHALRVKKKKAFGSLWQTNKEKGMELKKIDKKKVDTLLSVCN